MAAGRVIGAILLALLGGMVLNADDILRTAERQPQGWQRSIGVMVMRPVATIGHALLLDRPRAAIDTLLGRPTSLPSEDDVDAPSPATPTTTSTTVPAGPRVVTAAQPLRLFVGGDSMVGQFGPELSKRAEESGLVETTEVIYEFESGITRPDFVDWPSRLAQVTEEQQPEVVVLFFGGNDAQAIEIDGSWHEFGTPEWEAEYRRRVRGLMTQITDEGRDLYWMGMPIVSSDTFATRVELLNRVYRTEAQKIGGVTFFDSWPIFTGPDGEYAEYLPNADGAVVDMRLNDGIHLTTAGGVLLAEAVWKQIAADWKLAQG